MSIDCRTCGAHLADLGDPDPSKWQGNDKMPCPHCGSVLRQLAVTVHESVGPITDSVVYVVNARGRQTSLDDLIVSYTRAHIRARQAMETNTWSDVHAALVELLNWTDQIDERLMSETKKRHGLSKQDARDAVYASFGGAEAVLRGVSRVRNISHHQWYGAIQFSSDRGWLWTDLTTADGDDNATVKDRTRGQGKAAAPGSAEYAAALCGEPVAGTLETLQREYCTRLSHNFDLGAVLGCDSAGLPPGCHLA